MSKQILILPGDGIGPEIMAEAVKVLTRIDAQHGLGFTLVYDELGGAAYDKYGSPLADETLERARAADAVLLGAVGGPQWDTIDHRCARSGDCSRSARSLGCSPICVRHCCIRSWPRPLRSSRRWCPGWIC
ncbi:hypothetical protein XPN_1374 [Xanthomonas arboricola pv. pruni MAFF 301427]|nr:hypothetical protein XPN_1374 [Xanthomonas arboricola pv. pruni MAFF 301427]